MHRIQRVGRECTGFDEVSDRNCSLPGLLIKGLVKLVENKILNVLDNNVYSEVVRATDI